VRCTLSNRGRGRTRHQLCERAEDEKALLARFAKAAGAGEMLNIHDLKVAYEKAIGHETRAQSIIFWPGTAGAS